MTSFIATNLDDLIILMLFFSQVNANFSPWQIIVGQYLGFTLILLASSLGLVMGLIISEEWLGLLGFVPLVIGIQAWLDREPLEDKVQTLSIDLPPAERHSRWRALFSRVPPPIYSVASVTVANGGDNIGIYVPLLANYPPLLGLIIVGIFYLMVGIWCAIAYAFTRHPHVAKLLTNYGKKMSPVVYIALGIYLLVTSRAYRLLFPF